MNLKSLQDSFKDAVLGESSEALARLVRPAGTLSGEQSLKVYFHSAREKLVEALRDTCPACESLLGKARFRGIALGYVRINPHAGNDLNRYGEGFPAFLKLYCDDWIDAADELSCLPDLARLEWYYHCVYHAPDDPPFDFSGFARVKEHDRHRITFGVSEALHLLPSQYPLGRIWKLRKPVIEYRPARRYWCIYRDEMRPAIRQLSHHTCRLLQELTKGETLADLSRRFDRLDRYLPLLIKKQWITAFSLRHGSDTGA